MELFEKNDKEQEFQFNRSEMWLELEDIDEEFEEALKPHTKVFTNKLRPIWLFYLKNIQKLGFFDYVMAKDGSLGLARFFTQFREPEGIETKILIDSKHYRLVPECWKDNVILYRHCGQINKSETFVLSLTGHSGIATLDELNHALETLKKDYAPLKLIVMPFSMKVRGMERLMDGDSYLSSMIATVSKAYSGELEFVSLEELSKRNLDGCSCLNLNPGKTMYSESYIDQFLSSKGCHRIDVSVTDLKKTIRVGVNSYVEILTDWPSDHQNVRSKVESSLGDNLGRLLENERANDIVPVFFNSELYSFVEWVDSI